MAPSYTAMRSESKSPQVKCKGIHEPKGQVKGFRVEIRPPGSSKKRWVGTFDTRVKAKRAYDAAVYLTGKEPFYFVYPEGYFSSRPTAPSREDVQILAKKFAEKTDDLAESVASRLGVSSKAGQAKNVGSERTSPNTTIVRKVAEKMNSPLQPDPLKTLAGLDQFLQEAEYLEVPTLLDWTSLDSWPVQSKEVLEESKVDLEKSAYRRGLTSKQDIWKSLSDVPLPAPYEFPAIEDESFYLNFDTPLKVVWGEASMIQAERLLLIEALKDPLNERFFLLSDSCIPLYNSDYVYNYVISSQKSFVDSFVDYGDEQYNIKMESVIPRDYWRKGSQMKDLEDETERRTLTYSPWENQAKDQGREGWHPVTYAFADATLEAIKKIQVLEGSSTIMKTDTINKTKQSFELKEGNAGAYRFLKQLAAGAKVSIKVDPNAIYVYCFSDH